MIPYRTTRHPDESYAVIHNAIRDAVLVQLTGGGEQVRVVLTLGEAEHMIELLVEAMSVIRAKAAELTE